MKTATHVYRVVCANIDSCPAMLMHICCYSGMDLEVHLLQVQARAYEQLQMILLTAHKF